MATYYWRGSAGANSAVTGNWNTAADGSGSNPGSTDFNNDTLIFDGTVDTDCNFNNSAVEILKIQAGYSGTVTFANEIGIDDYFEFNGKIHAASAQTITFTNGAKTHPAKLTVEFGASASYGTGARDNLTFQFNIAGDRVVYFQNGQYPNVICNGAMSTATNPGFSPESVPISLDNVNSNYPYVDFWSLTVNSTAVWGAVENSDLGHPSTNDYDKAFRIGAKGSSQLTINATTWDMGKAKVILVGRSATNRSVHIPHTNNHSYNAGVFRSKIRHLELEKYSAQLANFFMRDGAIMQLEALTVGEYCMLTGPTDIDSYGAEIRLINRPKIRGSWSFGQKADGVYRSPLKGADGRQREVMCLVCSDESTALTTGEKISIHAPYNMIIESVTATVNTAPVGSTLNIDVNNNGTTIFDTVVTIDAGETSSRTAATPFVLDADGAYYVTVGRAITVDVDQIGSSTAGAGLKVWIYYMRG